MASSAPGLKPRLILCIDDDDISLRVRKLFLCNAGYDVLTASSGEAGLEMFRQNSVDLVIADHFLSAKSGTETAREMRALKPNVPILIVSGSTEEPTGIEFADGFLSKGESPDELLSIIASLLERRHDSSPS